MAYQEGTATGLDDLQRKLASFICGIGSSGATGFTGTGNGTLVKAGDFPFLAGTGCTPLTVTETWTITCITAAANGGTFSVVGSVSGAQANAVVGTPYDNGKLAFTINDGTTDFTVGAQFTIATTQGLAAAEGCAWEYLGRDAGGTGWPWFRGKGLSGTESIYFGMFAYFLPGSDVFNLWLGSSTTFNSVADNASQPGRSPTVAWCLWDSATPYFFAVNGQRIVGVTKVSTRYSSFYAGKILPYGTPTEYGYPFYLAATSSGLSTSWTTTRGDSRSFADPGQGAAYLYFPSGAWRAVVNYSDGGGSEQAFGVGQPSPHIWPYAAESLAANTDTRLRELRENVDGSYTLLPLIIVSNTPEVGVMGELDNVFYVSGFGNASENTVTAGGDDHKVFQNLFRTSRWDYFALKME
jgi:hypothetical protein